MSDRKPLNCTKEEYEILYTILEGSEPQTRYARHELISLLYSQYSIIKEARFYTAFEEIFKIICEKECHYTYTNYEVNEFDKFREKVYSILSKYKIKDIDKEQISQFLLRDELDGSSIEKYATGEIPSMMTYEEFIGGNNLDYGSEYFINILETIRLGYNRLPKQRKEQ